jgi:hypothetical protein
VVFQQLCDIVETVDWAGDTIKREKSPVGNEDNPDFIPFLGGALKRATSRS